MRKRIIITGGAGFIGSHLCEKFLKDRCSVVCVDNLITGQKKNINHLLKNQNFHFLQADITQKKTIKKILAISRQPSAINYILHFASPAGPNPHSPLSYYQMPIKTYLVNSLATHRLLRLAQKIKAGFLFASTSEIYGSPLEHPQKETYFGNTNPVGPRACYDESKRFGEMAAMTFAKKYQLPAKIIRIFNTYGPRMNPQDGRAIPTFITRALTNQPITIFGSGRQTRSFCYISDLVEGIMKVVEKGQNGQVYNLGSPEEVTINKTAELIIKLTNSRSKLKHQTGLQDDPQKRCPDISKAKKELGWQPVINFEKGLKKTISWFKL